MCNQLIRLARTSAHAVLAMPLRRLHASHRLLTTSASRLAAAATERRVPRPVDSRRRSSVASNLHAKVSNVPPRLASTPAAHAHLDPNMIWSPLVTALREKNPARALSAVEKIPFDELALSRPPRRARLGRSSAITNHDEGLDEVARLLDDVPSVKKDSRQAWNAMLVALLNGLLRTRGKSDSLPHASKPWILVGRLAWAVAARKATVALDPLQQLVDMIVPVTPKVPNQTLESLLMAHAKAGGMERLQETERMYREFVATNRVTLKMSGIVANLLADAAAHPDAPTDGRWGKDRVAAVRAIMDDAVRLGFIPSPFANDFLNGSLIRAATWQNGPLAAAQVTMVMADEGASLSGKTLSSLVMKLVEIQCFDQANELLALVDPQSNERFPFSVYVHVLCATRKYQEAIDLVGPRLEKVPRADHDWQLYTAHFEVLYALGQFQLMFDLHDDVIQSGMPLGPRYYLNLIVQTTRLGQPALDRALAYAEEMIQLGFPLDTATVLKLRREVVLHNDKIAKSRLEALLAAHGGAGTLSHGQRRYSEKVGVVLFACRRADTRDRDQKLLRARANLEALTQVGTCPPRLARRWWGQFMETLTFVYRDDPARLFCELRSAHVRLFSDPSRRDYIERHEAIFYLTQIMKPLSYARRLDLVLALWDTCILRLPSRNEALVQDPVWQMRIPGVPTPNMPLMCIVLDTVGRFGDLATLLDVEATLLKRIDGRTWPADENLFTTLIEAHFRLKDPSGARRILLDVLPRSHFDSEAKLRDTFVSQARLHGFSVLLKDHAVRSAIYSGPWPTPR
ncbi:hypothetical protein AMAG_16890 [Allomyces macrogynus ATCC 38327]|uniref:Pentatricopeptide repeat domain-containing protein n=1 Tax=Allomyces macrogynus (strain ATCC 38327) TaxID=578462 RepID=A0A0L0TCC9_ALLM3|nr:hypothetical protein AMAG_16890 [Allomyces macrogynus ATCC 38327]|eukprot:KNE72407.1 hypothetical protein AMAG_16890 [Allomyces macrogynus ATCC 38327]